MVWGLPSSFDYHTESTMNPRKTIMIIDDESRIRRLLSIGLEESGFDVCVFDNGLSALSAIRSMHEKPSLVVLDYMMPDMDGMEFLTEFRKTFSIPVIVLSAKDEVQSKTKAFFLGADDYVTKPFALEELIARIGAVLKRTERVGVLNQESIFFNGPFKVDFDKRKFFYQDKEIYFSDKEFRLITEMVKNKGRLLGHEELLRKVWGVAYIDEINYLRVTFTRIRKKLNEAGADGSVISSYSGVGYIMTDLNE